MEIPRWVKVGLVAVALVGVIVGAGTLMGRKGGG